jgi:hypothetical protein
MKVGDTVKFTLYDKEQTGTIVKVHKKSGWRGYVDVLLESKKEILMPTSILRLV